MRTKITDSHTTLMVDFSHGNSSKNHMNQPKVAVDVGRQLVEGEKSIVGIMFESNLKAGKQSSDKGRENLEWGVSITDACVDWDTTVEMLDGLSKVMPSK